jgi:putative transposase
VGAAGTLIPEASPGGRPRKTDMRAAMNAILYLLRTGCPWRYLPRDSFPPRTTVYNIFRKFQRDGVWDCDLGRTAYGVARADGAGSQPLGGGSRQPIGQIGRKRGGRDSQVGYDAGKRVQGRKIHALVDSEGLPMRVVVHSAAIQHRDGAGLVLDKIRRRFSWLGTGLGRWRVQRVAG